MNFINESKFNKGILIPLLLLVAVTFSLYATDAKGEKRINNYHNPKFVILMISDGWGANHIDATNKYRGYVPSYQNWDKYWMSTYPAGTGYDPKKAWSDFDYVRKSTVDSASSATSIYTGRKTDIGRINVSEEKERLFTITDKARILNMAIGAVSTVPISHATPGAWVAHNDNRFNSYAIAEEGLFGDPQSTRSNWSIFKKIRNSGQSLLKIWPRAYNKFKDQYDGGYGNTFPAADVLIGAAGPGSIGENYINSNIMDKLEEIDFYSENFLLIENLPGMTDGGKRLIKESHNPKVTKLVGLYDHYYSLADGSGRQPELPNLSEKTIAALNVLSRNKNGFVLMVEAGAVDWAGHANSMDKLIGEQGEFDDAVKAVIEWVEDPENESNWENTLVVVTGDHETGYLSAGLEVFPFRPIGEVNDRTIMLEKKVDGSNCKASWEDSDNNNLIDKNEKVYWAWNSCGSWAHTNSLVPLFTKGMNSEKFNDYIKGIDPVRGSYIDNTDVFNVMDSLITVQTIVDDQGNEMAVIPGGEFWMGCNEKTETKCLKEEREGGYVYIDAFAMDKTEVSVDQYSKCVMDGACGTEGLEVPLAPSGKKMEWGYQCNWDKEGFGNHPINCIDWFQAKAYCEWAGKRLPTELEWEKAARSTDRRVYPWGNEQIGMNGLVVNLADETAYSNNPELQYLNSYNDGFYTTSPVDSFKEGMSPYGLLNMAGNAWEWTADVCDFEEETSFKDDIKKFVKNMLYTKENALADMNQSTECMCVRGGSWKNLPFRLKTYYRAKDFANHRFGNTGFRCVR